MVVLTINDLVPNSETYTNYLSIYNNTIMICMHVTISLKNKTIATILHEKGGRYFDARYKLAYWRTEGII